MNLHTLCQESRDTLRLAAPVVIGQLSSTAMQTVDVIMLGHYSSISLSGMALGYTLTMFSFLVCTGVLFAIAPNVAQLHGAGRNMECGNVLSQGIWLALGLGLLLFLFLQRAEDILLLTGQDPELSRIAAGYVVPLSVGYPAALVFLALRQYLEGLTFTRPGMVVGLVALVLNAILNYFLIFGHAGLPELGEVGAAIATALVCWAELFLLAAYIWGSGSFREFGITNALRAPRWGELRPLLVLGLPIAASFGTEVSAFAGTSLMMGWFGALPMAASQVVMNLSSFTFMIPLGVAIAGTVRVGMAVGRNCSLEVERAGGITFALCGGFMLINALVLIRFPDLIVGLYSNDPEVLRLGASLLMVAAVFQLFDGLQVAGMGVLRGLKDTRVPLLSTIVAYWCVGLPLGYLLGHRLGFGPPGIWWGLAAGLATAAILHLLRFGWWMRRLAGDSPGQQAPR